MCEIDTMQVAILDDYQNVALSMADWSEVASRATIAVFNDHLADPDALVERLEPFDVVCVMRERTPLPRGVLERLPQLKMIASTGPSNASIDVAAAKERGIYVSTTGGYVESTVELTWALILEPPAGSSTSRYRCAMAAGRPPWAANSAAPCWGSWGWAASAAGSRRSARRSAWTSSRGAPT